MVHFLFLTTGDRQGGQLDIWLKTNLHVHVIIGPDGPPLYLSTWGHPVDKNSQGAELLENIIRKLGNKLPPQTVHQTSIMQ